MRRWWVIALGAVSLAAMAAFSATHLRVTTQITHFLPVTGHDRKLADLSRQLAESPLTRSMILSICGPTAQKSIAGAKALAAALRANPEVEWVRSGVGEQTEKAYYQLFFPHRYQLLSDHPEAELPARLDQAGLDAASVRLKRELVSPLGPLVQHLAPADPLLAFDTELERLQALREGPLDVRDGQFVTKDGKHAIVFLGTRHSAFDVAHQAPLLAAIGSSFAAVNREEGGKLGLAESGINRFAVASQRAIENDVNRISLFSTLAIALVFLLLFRSVRILALSFVPLAFGLATATTAGILAFGELHGLTLAFGATLIGVCVDYPILYLNHHALEPEPQGPRATLQRILGALVLGAATTLAGFGGLAWTAFPGIREVALFSAFGILGAFAATVWLLPALLPAARPASRLHRRAASAMGRVLDAMTRRRTPLLVAAAAMLLVCAVGLPRAHWNDNLMALTEPNPKLLAEDQAVRAQVSRMDASRLVVAMAPDDESALEVNDRIYDRLAQAKRDGLVGAFQSLHDVVYSAALQRRNLSQFSRSKDLGTRALAALAKNGFRPQAFSAFTEALARSPAPLTLSAVLASPLADLVRPFRVQMGNKVALLTLLRDVRHPKALAARLSGIPGAYYFDQEQFLSGLYRLFRVRTLELSLFGIFIVLAILFLSYRRPGLTVAAFLPALLASAGSLAILSLFGVTTNLLNVVSMLLVLSAGEDYAIFLVASVEHPESRGTTALSLVLCALSEVLGFGLLGMSQIPALRAIGLTTGIGILLSLVLAPLVLVLMPREAR